MDKDIKEGILHWIYIFVFIAIVVASYKLGKKNAESQNIDEIRESVYKAMTLAQRKEAASGPAVVVDRVDHISKTESVKMLRFVDQKHGLADVTCAVYINHETHTSNMSCPNGHDVPYLPEPPQVEPSVRN